MYMYPTSAGRGPLGRRRGGRGQLGAAPAQPLGERGGAAGGRGVQAHVLVEVAGVAEAARAVAAAQGLVARVRADVDLEPVAARVHFAAVQAQVPRGHAAPRRGQRLQLGGRHARRGARRGPPCRRRLRRGRGGGRGVRGVQHAAPEGACAVRPAAEQQVHLQRMRLVEMRLAQVARVTHSACRRVRAYWNTMRGLINQRGACEFVKPTELLPVGP